MVKYLSRRNVQNPFNGVCINVSTIGVSSVVHARSEKYMNNFRCET